MLYPPLDVDERRGIMRVIAKIEIDDREAHAGSCGDGSFDVKARNLEHNERMIALKVLRDVLQ